MKGNISVKILVDGKAVQFDISRSTTCDDVIKMASDNTLLPQSTKCCAVFECAFGVKKMLPGQTNVQKQVRSWGSSRKNFTLEVKEVDRVKTKIASLSRAKAKLNRLRSLIMKHELKVGQKFGTDLHENLDSNAVDKGKELYDKNITVLRKCANTVDRHLPTGLGKNELLKRYLSDSIEYQSFDNSCKDVDLPVRTEGVGREDDSFSESQLPERTRGDGDEDTSYSQLPEDEHDMNKGFIAFDTLADRIYDEAKDDLNECVIYDEDETSSFEAKGAFEDDSDYDSLCELERNILGNDSENEYSETIKIKRIFSNGDLNARISDDDLLDSFMNTFVNDDDSDEGMSSVDSDFD